MPGPSVTKHIFPRQKGESRPLLFYLLFMLLALFLSDLSLAQEKTKEVKIGVILPLTGVGATFGISAKNIIHELSAKFNKGSDNYTFKPIFEDGKCGSGNAAVMAAHKLINADNVKFMITACSGETLIVGPIAQRKKVVLIAIATVHPDVRLLGDYIFRIFYDMNLATTKMSQQIKADGHKRVAILAEENAFTQGMADEIETKLAPYTIHRDNYSGLDADFQSLFLRIRQAKADALFLACASANSCGTIPVQAKRVGFSKPIYSYYYFDQPDVQNALGDAKVGIKYLAAPSIKHSSPEFNEFWIQVTTKYKDEQKDEFVSRTAYDGFKAIIDGILAVGPDPTKVKGFLYDYRTTGAVGKISFDEAGDIIGLEADMKVL